MPQHCHSTGDAHQERRDASEARLDAERIRRERFGEHDVRDFAPIPLASCYVWPEQLLPMLPFITAFAQGKTVWEWRTPRFGAAPEWLNVSQLNLLQRPEWLSLVWREDAPSVLNDELCGGGPKGGSNAD